MVSSYPGEDTDMRSLDQYKVRGGNANNSCTVLSHLGFSVSCLGTSADDEDSEMMRTWMRDRDNISLEHCPRCQHEFKQFNELKQDRGVYIYSILYRCFKKKMIQGHLKYLNTNKVTFLDPSRTTSVPTQL